MNPIHLFAFALPSLLALCVALPGAALARDTATCDGKRSWQRAIVREAVHDWFRGQPDPDGLIDLVQAEHGIAACARGGVPRRLHTTSLPRGLAVDQLGAVLLANELEWSGLMPPPERALAGKFFRVRAEPESPYARESAYGADSRDDAGGRDR
jgi:hypothetical protein